MRKTLPHNEMMNVGGQILAVSGHFITGWTLSSDAEVKADC